jgi:hypothetical protein
LFCCSWIMFLLYFCIVSLFCCGKHNPDTIEQLYNTKYNKNIIQIQ